MTAGQLAFDVSTIIVALVGMLGVVLTGIFTYLGTRSTSRVQEASARATEGVAEETTAGSILTDVWAMYKDLDVRVSGLENENRQAHWFLRLARNDHLALHEAWPINHLDERPATNAELRPFIETGILPEQTSTQPSTTEVRVALTNGK